MPSPFFKLLAAGVTEVAISEDRRALLRHKCGQLGMFLRKFTVFHGKAGKGSFAGRCFGEKDVERQYYGSLAYANLEKDLQVTDQYGKGHMELTPNSFCTQALELSDVSTGSKGQRHQVWVIPGPIFAMRLITDAPCLP